MTMPNAESLSSEFRQAADEADRYLRSISRKAKDDVMYAFLYDDSLAKLKVYSKLCERPLVSSPGALVQELKQLRTASVPVPADAIDPQVFRTCRDTHLGLLIARFEHV